MMVMMMMMKYYDYFSFYFRFYHLFNGILQGKQSYLDNFLGTTNLIKYFHVIMETCKCLSGRTMRHACLLSDGQWIKVQIQ